MQVDGVYLNKTEVDVTDDTLCTDQRNVMHMAYYEDEPPYIPFNAL